MLHKQKVPVVCYPTGWMYSCETEEGIAFQTYQGQMRVTFYPNCPEYMKDRIEEIGEAHRQLAGQEYRIAGNCTLTLGVDSYDLYGKLIEKGLV